MLELGFLLFILIGILLLSALGFYSLVPIVILLGTFIAGFATREVKYGAFIGSMIAIGVGILFIILPILIPPLLLGGIRNFVWIILLSPIIGALGGLSGESILGRKPELPELPICPSCGRTEYALYMFCSRCGSRLWVHRNREVAHLPNHPRRFNLKPVQPPTQTAQSPKPEILSGFEGLRRIPPPIKNTIFCPSCKTPNDPGAHFCGKCGSTLK